MNESEYCHQFQNSQTLSLNFIGSDETVFIDRLTLITLSFYEVIKKSYVPEAFAIILIDTKNMLRLFFVYILDNVILFINVEMVASLKVFVVIVIENIPRMLHNVENNMKRISL